MASSSFMSSRTTSQPGTRRERFLKSLGIPSFQHPIEPKAPYLSDSNALTRGGVSKGEDLVTSSSSVPNNVDKAGSTGQGDKATTLGLPVGSTVTSLATVEADKRLSSIRLRNYRSIGNLDVKNREDQLSDRPEKDKNDLFMGGNSGTKSVPLSLNHSLDNEQLEGEVQYNQGEARRAWLLKHHTFSFLRKPQQNFRIRHGSVIFREIGRAGKNSGHR
jgi:hypothetical protein